jgi:imidazolonepropionase-like amidohydrolase
MTTKRSSWVIAGAVAVTIGMAQGAKPAGEQGGAARPTKLALVGGMLLDGYEAGPIHRAAVLIDGERIVRVAPAAEVTIPPDYTVIDTSGRTMMPGMIELHGH